MRFGRLRSTTIARALLQIGGDVTAERTRNQFGHGSLGQVLAAHSETLLSLLGLPGLKPTAKTTDQLQMTL